MKINWKLRLKNKATLTALVGALVLFVNSVANAFGFDVTDVVGNIEGILGTIISLLVWMGVVVDPTSKGVSDSGIAQTYDKPRNSKNEDEQVDWESNKYIPEQWHDENEHEVTTTVDGLRNVQDSNVETINNNYDSDINNSGVMLDSNQQVEGSVLDGKDTSGN